MLLGISLGRLITGLQQIFKLNIKNDGSKLDLSNLLPSFFSCLLHAMRVIFYIKSLGALFLKSKVSAAPTSINAAAVRNVIFMP